MVPDASQASGGTPGKEDAERISSMEPGQGDDGAPQAVNTLTAKAIDATGSLPAVDMDKYYQTMLRHRSAKARTLIGFALTLAVVSYPHSAARAASTWYVDDTCTVSDSGTYFYLAGPLSGWHIHSGSGVNNCHLYNQTTSNANPHNRANYLLPNDPNYNANFKVSAYINCHHNNAKMKYWGYTKGTAAGPQWVTGAISVSSFCNQYAQVIAQRAYTATMGAYVQLLDNTGTATTYQNADMHVYVP